MFIYRDSYYKSKEATNAEDENARQDRGEVKLEEAEIIIAKQRNGPTGKAIVGFMPAYTRFVNLERHRTDDMGD